MHEAGVVQRIVDVVSERASEADAARVTDVYLEISEKPDVDTEAISLHWPILSDGTVAYGAQLHFETVPAPHTFRLVAIEVAEHPPDYADSNEGSGRRS